MTEASDSTSEKRQIQNCTLRVPDSAIDLVFTVGHNLVTGLPLTGDTIHHKATGRKFKVTERIWPADEDRTSNVVLVLEELG